MYIYIMEFNNINFGEPVMLVGVCVGMMVMLTFVLPMLPSMPLVDDMKLLAEYNKDNLLPALVTCALAVYLGVFVKKFLNL